MQEKRKRGRPRTPDGHRSVKMSIAWTPDTIARVRKFAEEHGRSFNSAAMEMVLIAASIVKQGDDCGR